MSREPTFSHFPNLPPPARVRLTTLGPQPCAYLPGRTTRVRALATEFIDPSTFSAFLDANFRRSGQVIYQPTCDGCRECRSIRVPVERFAPSRSQRRSATRNADVQVDVASPLPTQEKFELYQRYTNGWHGKTEASGYADFVAFLYASPTRSIEFSYRTAEGRLLGVGICDVSPTVLSSVYFWYDPDAAGRSLGTFSAVREIAFARERAIPYYHLGYWIRDCAAMAYKANFRPTEVLHPDGVWRTLDETQDALSIQRTRAQREEEE